jgi:Gnt-I system high-affinity gluconate transporter
MPILIVIAGLLLLILLIAVLKLNTFVAFVIVSILVGLAEGMNPDSVIKAMETGIGNTLGSLVIILSFGAMLGKLVADSGAAQRISTGLVRKFGNKHIHWALMITGFVVGIPLFYNVGFVILVPLIFTIAASSGLPLLYVAIPMLASLSVTHGFLPPHPSPSAIAVMFHANMGKALLYGLAIAVPVIILAGPLFARTLKGIKASPLKEFINPRQLDDAEMPGMTISLLTALLPVILIIVSTLIGFTALKDTLFGKIVAFTGNPSVALLLSVLLATYTLGIARGRKMKELTEMLSGSVLSITMILLIIAGAGILKQVLTDSGVSIYIADWLGKSNASPLFLGWLIAAIIRVCVGSATVAGLTAAGIVLPMLATGTVNSELMVLAIGAGSLMLSHVNDVGFWMFKEYFNTSIKDTLKTWTAMETIVGVSGLAGVLLLNIIFQV